MTSRCFSTSSTVTGNVEQVHFDQKIYDTTDGRYNHGVFIVTEPRYYQFVSAGGCNAIVHRLPEALQSKYQG